jgi:uncharacterized protein YjbI with pentapeptide repeats
MVAKRELIGRWGREPGQAILQHINEFCFQLQMPGHGHSSEEIFAMLEGLPYRYEVPNGRDLRGATLSGGVHELDFSECDFSYAHLDMNFINCDFTAARCEEITGRGIILTKTLNRASFRRAKLTSCFLIDAKAQKCSFDEATLTGTSFEGADLTDSSFRETNCGRVKFLRANLRGCDFRKTTLDEAVFQEVRLDKSTDLRGASLINLYHHEHRDAAGKLVARGTDWRQATYDASTVFGQNPAATVIEVLDAALTLLSGSTEARAERLRNVLTRTKAELQQKYRATWYEDVLAAFEASDKPYVEQVLTQSMESLL